MEPPRAPPSPTGLRVEEKTDLCQVLEATANTDDSDNPEPAAPKAGPAVTAPKSDDGLELEALGPPEGEPTHDVRSIRSDASRGRQRGDDALDGSTHAGGSDSGRAKSSRRATVRTESSSRRVSIAESTVSIDLTAESSANPAKSHWYNKYLPYIGYHHVLMIFAGVVVIALPLVLAGCTTTGGMQGLRLVSISYAPSPPSAKPSMLNATLGSLMLELSMNETQGAPQVREVQVGYFAICARLEPGDWQCGINGATVPGKVEVDDPLGLVDMGHRFRTETVSSALLIITILLCAVTIVALSTFPGWHEEVDTGGSMREVKPFPSRAVSVLVLLFSALATAMVYVAVLWQHVSCAATGTLLESLRYGAVEVHTGTAAAVLGWMSVFLCATCTVGVIVMILSIRLLVSL